MDHRCDQEPPSDRENKRRWPSAVDIDSAQQAERPGRKQSECNVIAEEFHVFLEYVESLMHFILCRRPTGLGQCNKDRAQRHRGYFHVLYVLEHAPDVMHGSFPLEVRIDKANH